MTSCDKKPLGIVLLSGGMDSCVTAAIAAKECRLAMLHVDYGQRTRAREYIAFMKIAAHYKVPDELLMHCRLDALKAIGGSALTDSNIDVPHPESPDGEEGVPITYVPFRNTHIISIAVSWAEVIGAERIYVGAVSEDSAGYPDCRPEYYEAMNRLIAVGSSAGSALKVLTPVIGMNKAGIVETGMRLDAPLEHSWSCYSGNEKACGKCDSCQRRLRAFKEAGFKDPIPYE